MLVNQGVECAKDSMSSGGQWGVSEESKEKTNLGSLEFEFFICK